MSDKPAFRYLLGGISITVTAGTDMLYKEAMNRMKRKGMQARALHFRLFKRSVDARNRDDIRYVCTVLITLDQPVSPNKLERYGLREWKDEKPQIILGKDILKVPPLVVGMGPAGLFAALILAGNGFRPMIIDRGDSVYERVRTVERFQRWAELDTESNIQFGAGGAGTFSDGKLVTRIHDPLCRFVLETFHRFGAPDEILTLAKPHIGTDILQKIVSNILQEIERLGGTVIYRCRMDSFRELSDNSVSVQTSNGEINCGALFLALGHSARDTYQMLIEKQFAIEAKPISVGVRVEHLQSDIDRALYGSFAGTPALGHAEYALSDTKGERGVYTFCMCPGGEVVAAASEAGGLVVNGMSRHARDGANANSAVAVSLSCSDYESINGNLALGAISLQRHLEHNAFLAGGSDYDAPVMTVGDFLGKTKGTEPTRVVPSYRNGKVKVTDISSIFPESITGSLRYAFSSFGKSISGFDDPAAVITAAETRTSAPLRILRLPDRMTAIGHKLVYPCGEGAGYAGGITSAGVDGLRSALSMMKVYGGLYENHSNGN